MHSSAVPYSNPVTEHTIMSILQKSTLKLERFIGMFKFAQLTQRFNSGPLTPEAYIFACNTTSSLLVAREHQHYEQPGHVDRGAEHNRGPCYARKGLIGMPSASSGLVRLVVMATAWLLGRGRPAQHDLLNHWMHTQPICLFYGEHLPPRLHVATRSGGAGQG